MPHRPAETSSPAKITPTTTPATTPANRRQFLKTSASAAAVGVLAAAPRVHAAENNTLKIGLIGCGGRGSGAAVNAFRADPNIQLTVLADAFPDRLEHCQKILKRRMGDKYQVDQMNCYTGFDAYEKVMKTNVDVVLLCTPPHFRPAHLEAAVAAGKHIFCEKPVAVDAPGVRRVLAAAKAAKEKNLNLVSGLCWRYDYGVRETMKRIKDGALGEIVAVQENYLTGGLWHRGRKPEWSEMEYQMRNWLYFTWLSGDHIVEQYVHSLDKAMWLMDDAPPLRCFGLGGRQVRTDEKWGNIFDHFAVCYEWKNGFKTFAYTRQMPGCKNDVEDYVMGTKGNAKVLKHQIESSSGMRWRYRGDKPSMYDVEHKELFAAIRKGQTINNGTYMSYSTMLAILGREACYTGQIIEWDKAMQSTTVLGPSQYQWGDVEIPTVAKPGVTTFS